MSPLGCLLKTTAACALLALAGCSRGPASQRFVLVPETGQINPNIPAGALALDTQTGELCYTVGGSFTSGFPAIDMCHDLVKSAPSH